MRTLVCITLFLLLVGCANPNHPPGGYTTLGGELVCVPVDIVSLGVSINNRATGEGINGDTLAAFQEGCEACSHDSMIEGDCVCE